MGLFSFLFGGKKTGDKSAAKPAAEKPIRADKTSASVAKTPAAIAPVVTTPGFAQAKLRLKLAASLRSGHTAVAYESAKALAEIQVRAGRKTVARVWQQQADRIKAGLSA